MLPTAAIPEPLWFEPVPELELAGDGTLGDGVSASLKEEI